MSYLNSYQKGVIFYQKHKLFYTTQVNDGLSDASKAVWQDRALLWGTDCFYSPDEVTQQFLDMVFAEDSPVVAVIGAHLHFAYDDQLTEKIPQYVFDASFKGKVGVITVK